MPKLNGIDCDYIYEIINSYGVDEVFCRKRIYDISCSECIYNNLNKRIEKYKYFIDRFNNVR